LEYRILGPLEVVHDGRSLPVGGAKQRALLVVLLLHANEVVSVDRLIDDVWGEEPPDSAQNLVQTYVSRLRKVLEPASGASALVSRRPGYELRVRPGELDLDRFERLLDEARQADPPTSPAAAASKLREALSLWRGDPLADFAFETFAQREIERLRELRVGALEDRIQADIDLGRGPDLVGELQSLVAATPLRERLRGQLMVALYRAGRQAEALAVYQEARRVLADELGIDPGPELQRLERAILTQDPALRARPGPTGPAPSPRPQVATAERSILVAPRSPTRMDAILGLAEPLAVAEGNHDLLLARLVGPWEDPPSGPEVLAQATRELNGLRSVLLDRGTPCRVVAFTSQSPGDDLARLIDEYPVDLLVMDGTIEMTQQDELPGPVREVLEGVECDVAILLNGEAGFESLEHDRPVVAPFGGAEHDWPAVQLASWFATAHRAPLRLLGSTADMPAGQRDASRLLGRASLIVQEMSGVVAEPVLVDPGPGVLEEATRAGLVVVGLSDRWTQEGLGPLRAEIARTAGCPVVLVRRGSRSTSGPSAQLTRFGWSRARGPVRTRTPPGRDARDSGHGPGS
jgi:DNA-binding SARP family transcriptional activator